LCVRASSVRLVRVSSHGDQIGGAQRFDRARAGVAQGVPIGVGDDHRGCLDHQVNGGSVVS